MKSIKQQYIDLQEGKMSQTNFMRNLRMTMPHLVTNVTSFNDSIKILKNKGILSEISTKFSFETADKLKKAIDSITANNDEFHRDGFTMGFFEGKNEKLNEERGMSFEEACAEAKQISEDEGVVQHVEEIGNDRYIVSDWYDSDKTVRSYENGNRLNELSSATKKSAYNKAADDVLNLDKDNDELKLKRRLSQADTFGTHVDPSLKKEGETIAKMINPDYTFMIKKTSFAGGESTVGLYFGLHGMKEGTAKVIVFVYKDKYVIDRGKEEIRDNVGRRLERFINTVRKTEMSLNEVKQNKETGAYGQDGESMYKEFSEGTHVNYQELVKGIKYEHEQNPYEEYKKIVTKVIKNLKKDPNYYTHYALSGTPGFTPQIIGNVKPSDRAMKFVKGGDMVDKAMGMKPVKDVEKHTASANKANKETHPNKIGKVELMSLIAKTVRGIQKMEATGEKNKKINVKEAYFINRPADANKYKIVKDSKDNIVQATNQDGITFSKNDEAIAVDNGEKIKIIGFKDEQTKIKAIYISHNSAYSIDIDGLKKSSEFPIKGQMMEETRGEQLQREIQEMFDGRDNLTDTEGGMDENYTPENIQDMRDWLKDLSFRDIEDIETFVDELSDNEVIDAVKRHYDGGLKQFIEDSLLENN